MREGVRMWSGPQAAVCGFLPVLRDLAHYVNANRSRQDGRNPSLTPSHPFETASARSALQIPQTAPRKCYWRTLAKGREKS